MPPTLIGGLIFTATTAVQARFWLANTTTFWLPAGLSAARWTIEMTLLRAAEANWPLLLAGLAGLALMALSAVRSRTIDQGFAVAGLLGAGVLLALAALVGIHLWRPFIFERYLLGFIPAMAIGLAVGADRILRSRQPGWTVALFAIACLWGGANALRAAASPETSGSWTGSAAFVGQRVRQCPGALVHVDLDWTREAMAAPPADNRAVVPMAYAMMARRFGFSYEPAASRRMAAHCPTLFWAEWMGEAWSARRVLDYLRARGFPVQRITLYRFDRGFVAEAATP